MKDIVKFCVFRIMLTAVLFLAASTFGAGDPVCAPFSSETVAFLPFNDHPDGTHLCRADAPAGATYVYDVFTNSVTPGSYNMGILLKTTAGVHVTNDAPGRYIFPSKAAKAPIAVCPAGIRHEGAACLFMNGTTSLLSSLQEYTVEFFCKIAPFGGSTRVALFYDPAPGNNLQRPSGNLPAGED